MSGRKSKLVNPELRKQTIPNSKRKFCFSTSEYAKKHFSIAETLQDTMLLFILNYRPHAIQSAVAYFGRQQAYNYTRHPMDADKA